MAEDRAWEAVVLALWAKVGSPPHSLLSHLLDTGATALAILEREPARTRRLYAEDWSLPEEEALRWVAFLVGLHDLGKASPTFQAAWPDGAQRVWDLGLTWDRELVEESWVAHGVFTELYVKDHLQKLGLTHRVATQIAQGLGAHHGFLVQGAEWNSGLNLLCCEPPDWARVRDFLVKRLQQAFELSDLPTQKEEPSPEAILRVMALASFADWIASDPAFFPYKGRPSPLDAAYLQEALDRARSALCGISWPSYVPAPRKFFKELFTFPPNSLQDAVARLVEQAAEPVLLLVEAPMGLGKTEAALYAYHLLQRQVGHRGLYVALPTQATANSLFHRVRTFLEKLGPDVPLDLQLQHGAAALNPEYGRLLEQARPQQVYEDAVPHTRGDGPACIVTTQ